MYHIIMCIYLAPLHIHTKALGIAFLWFPLSTTPSIRPTPILTFIHRCPSYLYTYPHTKYIYLSTPHTYAWYTHECVCMYAIMQTSAANTYTFILYTGIYTFIYVYTWMYIYTCTHTDIYRCMYIYMDVYMYIKRESSYWFRCKELSCLFAEVVCSTSGGIHERGQTRIIHPPPTV